MPGRLVVLLLTVTLAGAAACSGSNAGAAAQTVAVSVTPNPVEVLPGGKMAFTASVSGTASTAVAWSVQEGADGGAITSDGMYTAPATPGAYHVVATSAVDSGATSVVPVTVTTSAGPVVVVSPAEATVDPGAKIQLRATIYNAKDQGVAWSVEEGADGGAVDGNGLYTAPTKPGTYNLVARQNGAATSTSTLTARSTLAVSTASGRSKIKVRGVAVAISPQSVTLAAGGIQAFTATVTGTTNASVTWSVQEAAGCGSISQAGSYVAPAAAATCHVVAASVADPTKTAVATVTVTAPSGVTVAVAPASSAVDACASLPLKATVSGTTNQAVTWSVQEGASGGSVTSAGVYTAPTTDGTYHVVATSAADATAKGVTTLTVASRVVAVAVNPSSVTVAANTPTQLTAVVTTTCGQVTTP